MRRSTRTASVVLACTAAFSAVGGAAGAAQAATTTTAVCSSSQTLDIANMAFQPPTIPPGGSSVLTTTVVNCSSLPQTAAVEWLGHYVFASSIPAGCPVIDPLLGSLNLPPGGVAIANVAYNVPGGCNAIGLVVTAEILQGGQVVAQRSAQLGIEQPLPPAMLP